MSSQPTRAFLGMSHTPLYGLNPLEPHVETSLQQAIVRARKEVLKFAPELIVLVGPDHYNGFFNELMPPLCIGSQATAVGDYLTPAGALNVDEDAALGLAEWLMEHDFDLAMSRRMEVDHGFSQVLQFIWGDDLKTPPVVPIFMNAVAQPGIPRLRRCLQLGREIGRFLDTLPQRTLLIGSGGLSHEPPVPLISGAAPEIADFLIAGRNPTPEARAARQARTIAVGKVFGTPECALTPLNPEWDQAFMDLLVQGRLAEVDDFDIEAISRTAGRSTHEIRTWVAAFGALSAIGPYTARKEYYRAINEWIAGYGVVSGASAA